MHGVLRSRVQTSTRCVPMMEQGGDHCSPGKTMEKRSMSFCELSACGVTSKARPLIAREITVPADAPLVIWCMPTTG